MNNDRLKHIVLRLLGTLECRGDRTIDLINRICLANHAAS